MQAGLNVVTLADEAFGVGGGGGVVRFGGHAERGVRGQAGGLASVLCHEAHARQMVAVQVAFDAVYHPEILMRVEGDNLIRGAVVADLDGAGKQGRVVGRGLLLATAVRPINERGGGACEADRNRPILPVIRHGFTVESDRHVAVQVIRKRVIADAVRAVRMGGVIGRIKIRPEARLAAHIAATVVGETAVVSVIRGVVGVEKAARVVIRISEIALVVGRRGARYLAVDLVGNKICYVCSPTS